MKKVEAQIIAPEKSKLLLEYIDQFMSYGNVRGEILINSDKDPETKERMCYMEILIDDGFERHYNTDITAQQSDVLNEQILIDIAERYAQDKDVDITRYFTLNSMDGSIHGIRISNHKGSNILLNFLCRGLEFDKVVESYSKKLSEERNKIQRSK